MDTISEICTEMVLVSPCILTQHEKLSFAFNCIVDLLYFAIICYVESSLAILGILFRFTYICICALRYKQMNKIVFILVSLIIWIGYARAGHTDDYFARHSQQVPGQQETVKITCLWVFIVFDTGFKSFALSRSRSLPFLSSLIICGHMIYQF